MDGIAVLFSFVWFWIGLALGAVAMESKMQKKQVDLFNNQSAICVVAENGKLKAIEQPKVAISKTEKTTQTK